MKPDEYVTDDEILSAIDDLRELYGACTLAALGEHLNRGKGTMATRINKLKGLGLVTQSHLPGSIRVIRAAP